MCLNFQAISKTLGKGGIKRIRAEDALLEKTIEVVITVFTP